MFINCEQLPLQTWHSIAKTSISESTPCSSSVLTMPNSAPSTSILTIT